MKTTGERLVALESEINSLRSELSRVTARQQRADDSLMLLIRTWQPFMLSAGEGLVDLSRGAMRSPVLKRLRSGMAAIREMLPSMAAGDSAPSHKQ